MLNETQAENFQIENFEPRHLKKARVSLEKHLKAVEQHAQTNDAYKKGLLKEPSLWDKIKHTLHLD
jgi:hypothetical protein